MSGSDDGGGVSGFSTGQGREAGIENESLTLFSGLDDPEFCADSLWESCNRTRWLYTPLGICNSSECEPSSLQHELELLVIQTKIQKQESMQITAQQAHEQFKPFSTIFP